jgi:hypothetical protein
MRITWLVKLLLLFYHPPFTDDKHICEAGKEGNYITKVKFILHRFQNERAYKISLYSSKSPENKAVEEDLMERWHLSTSPLCRCCVEAP